MVGSNTTVSGWHGDCLGVVQTMLRIAHHPNFPGKSSKQGHQCQSCEYVFLPCNSKSTEQEGLKQQLQFAEGHQPLTWKRKQCPGITGHVHHCCFWQAGGQLVCNWWYHILVTLGKVLPDLEVQISDGGFQCLTSSLCIPPETLSLWLPAAWMAKQ